MTLRNWKNVRSQRVEKPKWPIVGQFETDNHRKKRRKIDVEMVGTKLLFFCSFPFLSLYFVRPLSLCAVLNNQGYINQSLTIRANILHGTHGSYLISTETCDGKTAIPGIIQPNGVAHLNSVKPGEWPDAAVKRGRSGPYIVEGYFFLSTGHLPHTKQDAMHLEFDATRIRSEESK